MNILSWFRRAKDAALSKPPPLMEIAPGAEYIMKVGNPFMPDPKVRVLDVRGGWVQYVFTDSQSHLNHTKEEYFRHCYRRIGPQSKGS